MAEAPASVAHRPRPEGQDYGGVDAVNSGAREAGADSRWGPSHLQASPSILPSPPLITKLHLIIPADCVGKTQPAVSAHPCVTVGPQKFQKSTGVLSPLPAQ